MSKWDVLPRRMPNIRAELQRLADEREAMLGQRFIDPRKGLPVHVAPPSGAGGDIMENRMIEP